MEEGNIAATKVLAFLFCPCAPRWRKTSDNGLVLVATFYYSNYFFCERRKSS